MPLPNSILAFQDCTDFMSRALEDDKGARLFFLTEAEAQNYRMRLNQARELDRRENKMIHELGHMLHGKSEFDLLQFTIRDDVEGQWWIYARKMILDESRVELLSEVEAGDDAGA
jgi:hypothetical protein